MEELQFDLPKRESSYIKVIGVGGGGGNAVKNMYREGITGVDYIICNTDAQALANNPVPVKIQLGTGLGAGNHPEVARAAIEEKRNEIRHLLENNTRMLFIAAGMGGGTGTGAAPVVAEIAKEIELDDDIKKILIVAIVTTPFSFEGKKRREQAADGLRNLRKHTDAIIVLNSDKLLDYDKTLSVIGGFALMDKVICTAAKGISEIITKDSYINVDFKDVNTVMKESGVALMGYGMASGENRAQTAIEDALDAPLLNDNSIAGAKNVLFHVSFSTKNPLRIDELRTITDVITEHTGIDSADIIWGGGEDESVNDNLVITLIATGFDEKTFEKGPKIIDINGEQRPPRPVPAMPAGGQNKVILNLDENTNRKTTNIPTRVTDTVQQQDTDKSHIPAGVTNMNIPTRVTDTVRQQNTDSHIPTRVTDTVQQQDTDKSHIPVRVTNTNIPTRVTDTVQQQNTDSHIPTRVTDTIRQQLDTTDKHIPEKAAVTDIFARATDTAEAKHSHIPARVADTVQKDKVANTLHSVVEDRMRRMRELKEKMQSYAGVEQIAKEPAFIRSGIEINTATRHSLTSTAYDTKTTEDGRITENNFFSINID